MGRGAIVGGGSDGRYQVLLDVGEARRQQWLAAFDAAIANLDKAIEERVDLLEQLEAVVVVAQAAYEDAAQAYAAARQLGQEATGQLQITQAVFEHAAQRVALTIAERNANRSQLESIRWLRGEQIKRRQRIASAQTSRTVEAWCADLTEDASGLVATVEVPGEPAEILIAPGGRPPQADDGRLLARGVMSPEEAYFNAAILPGWQRHMPMYRLGTITSLSTDSNRANVTLLPVSSSARGLAINPQPFLTNVRVQYMSCDAAAFEIGDEVLVRFDDQSWDHPTVVGFRREPRPCGRFRMLQAYYVSAEAYWTATEEDLQKAFFRPAEEMRVEMRLAGGPWIEAPMTFDHPDGTFREWRVVDWASYGMPADPGTGAMVRPWLEIRRGAWTIDSTGRTFYGRMTYRPAWYYAPGVFPLRVEAPGIEEVRVWAGDRRVMHLGYWRTQAWVNDGSSSSLLAQRPIRVGGVEIEANVPAGWYPPEGYIDGWGPNGPAN